VAKKESIIPVAEVSEDRFPRAAPFISERLRVETSPLRGLAESSAFFQKTNANLLAVYAD